MPSAVLFFRCRIIELTNCVTRSDPYAGSPSTVRFAFYHLRGINQLLAPSGQLLAWTENPLSLLGPLRSILRAALHAVRDPDSVKGSANHVITHSWQVLHAAPADQHNRVLLQVVTDARDISRHFNSVGQPDAGDFPQGRVRLFRRLCVDTRA